MKQDERAGISEIDELLRERDQQAPTARGAARQRRIIESAIELFRMSGYHGTSMDQIGSAAGVSGPALYHHFRNKQAILAAVFFQSGDRLFEQIANASRDVLEPGERLRVVIERYVDAVINMSDVVAVVYAELGNLAPADSDRVRRRRGLFNEYLAHAISQVRTDLLPSEAQQLASALVWMAHSVAFVEPALDAERLRPFLVDLATGAVRSATGHRTEQRPVADAVHGDVPAIAR